MRMTVEELKNIIEVMEKTNHNEIEMYLDRGYNNGWDVRNIIFYFPNKEGKIVDENIVKKI